MIDLTTIRHAESVSIMEVARLEHVVAFCPECNEHCYGTETCEYDRGIFHVLSEKSVLNVIADSGEGWDHVSVSVKGEQRCPTWEEMEFVKRAFFKPDECAMQLHVPVEDHVSIHPYVLHIWRPYETTIPTPPKSRL